MAKHEEKRPVISKVQREVLQILREAGDLTLAFLLNAGDSARLWQYVGGKRKRERIRRSLAALERRGFIDMNKHGGETRIALSRDGKRIALVGNIEKISLPMVKHWDRKWRIILFDIPERFGTARRALSKRLRDMPPPVGPVSRHRDEEGGRGHFRRVIMNRRDLNIGRPP